MIIENLLEWSNWGLINTNKMQNYKILIANNLENTPTHVIFSQKVKTPTVPNIDFISKLNITNSIKFADYVLVPHQWNQIKDNKEYLVYLKILSKSVPLIIANFGDRSPKMQFENTLELRTFLHPWEDLNRKIVLPYPVDSRIFRLRKWRPIPRVSFMGYLPRLGLGTLFSRDINGILQIINSSSYIQRRLSIYRLRKLESSLQVNIVKRNKYTAFKSNPDLVNLMEEFQKDLNESDYILCPRGTANVSIRFFETLSAGATPILVHSGGQLPIINSNLFWDSNVLKVNLTSDWRKAVLNDWNSIGSDVNYTIRQFKNHDTFINELSFEKYLSRMFNKYLR
jgi:hypothetical protein